MKHASLLLVLAAAIPAARAFGQTAPSLPQSFGDLNVAVRAKTSDAALQSALSALGFSKPDYDDESWDMYVKIGPDCDPKKIPSETQIAPSEKRCAIVDVWRNDAGPIWAVLTRWGSGFHPAAYGIVYEENKGSPTLSGGKNADDFLAHKLDGLKAQIAKFKTDLAK